ncbi:hypothetical protein EG329_012635 [Mollisiaceae sp. DMI_Dod_QoI]|nr:hypothetical protein EG329_012635 [Helotiales sp. DMI_Dod_QoI]
MNDNPSLYQHNKARAIPSPLKLSMANGTPFASRPIIVNGSYSPSQSNQVNGDSVTPFQTSLSSPAVNSPSYQTNLSNGDPVAIGKLRAEPKRPSPYCLSFNPLLLMQRDLRELRIRGKDDALQNKLRHYLHNTWNHMIEMNNKLFNERTRCRLCGQTPRVEYSFREMNHHLPHKALEIWRGLQKDLEETKPEAVTMEDMEEFYKTYWDVERTFWEDDASVGCNAATWTGGRA